MNIANLRTMVLFQAGPDVWTRVIDGGDGISVGVKGELTARITITQEGTDFLVSSHVKAERFSGDVIVTYLRGFFHSLHLTGCRQ